MASNSPAQLSTDRAEIGELMPKQCHAKVLIILHIGFKYHPRPSEYNHGKFESILQVYCCIV